MLDAQKKETIAAVGKQLKEEVEDEPKTAMEAFVKKSCNLGGKSSKA